MPQFGIVNATQLNLRARPTTDSEIVQVLSRDAAMEILRDAGFGWLEVKLIPSGTKGFVSRVFLRLVDSLPGGTGGTGGNTGGGTPSADRKSVV